MIKKNPKCQCCKERFVPRFNNSLQKFCMEKDDCIAAFLAYKKSVDEKKKKTDWNKEKVILKDKIKSLSDWQKELEKECNKICCLIDKNKGCISCKGKTTPQSGHYHAKGSNRAIMFHLDNLHVQDYNCNCSRGGNIHQYDLGLIERYGKRYWEYVKFDLVRLFPTLKMAQHEYADKISTARSIIKWLQLQDREFSLEEQRSLRTELNTQIGIYL